MKDQESTSTCSIDSFDDSSLPSTSMEDLDTVISNAWTSEKLHAIADRWKLNEREQEQMAELRHRLSDVYHHKNDPEEVVRFLREARSIKGGERMFRRYIKFRINRVDSILQDYDPDPVLKSHFPMTLLNGFDKDGDGIWVERPGVTDCYGLFQRFGREELIRYCLWAREAACNSPWKRTYVADKARAPRMTCIVDLKGLNRGHMRPVLLPILAEVVMDIQNYYCGFIKKIIIVREPAIFKVIWNMVKHCFNANMRDLMVFAGSDYVNVLKEYIDDLEDNLPPCLLEGGTGSIAEGLPQRMEGGRLPPKQSAAYLKNTELFSTGRLSDEEEQPPLMPSESYTSTSSRMSPLSGSHGNVTVRLNQTTEHESMEIKCQLLAKGSF